MDRGAAAPKSEAAAFPAEVSDHPAFPDVVSGTEVHVDLHATPLEVGTGPATTAHLHSPNVTKATPPCTTREHINLAIQLPEPAAGEEEEEEPRRSEDAHSAASLRTNDPLYSDAEENAQHESGRRDHGAAREDAMLDDEADFTEHLAQAIYDHHEPSCHASKKAEVHNGTMHDLLDQVEGRGGMPLTFKSESDPTSPTPKKPARVNLLHLFNRENIKVTVVPIIGGLITGYTFALVPVYSQLFVTGTNCALYTTPIGCEAVPFADCVWRTDMTTLSDGTTRSLGYCGWRGFTCRAAYPNDAWVGGGGNTTLAESSCLQDSRCTWSYSARECQNPSGFSRKELSIFAGSMIAGNMVGAIFGGPLVTSMGTRLTFLVSGFYSIITCIMGHVDAYVSDFWVLAASRFVLGIFMGLITVACPLYVHENADPFYKPKTGTMFQVFSTIGGFLAAIIAIGVGETIHYDSNADQHVSGRMQAVAAGQTLLSILLFLLGIFSAESKVKFKKGVAGALDQNEYSYWKMAPRLLMVVALNATFRFTGFNALGNFGPKLMASFKVAPFLGLFIIMTVNVAGGLMSMPASLLASPKKLFLFGSCFISCMCLFFCGVPVYPGVASESVTNNCAVVGICLYIFAYEVFVGPSFYVLCQEIFPPSFRPRGNSFAQLWQFSFNLVINVCYPIAVESFSGGPEGNQHKGQSIVFIFFGSLGLVLFAYEFFFLDLWDEAAEAERKRKAAEELLALAHVDCYDDQAAARSADETPAEMELRARE